MKPVIIIAIAFTLIFVMTSAERVFGYADDEVEIIVSVDKSSYKVGDLLTIKGTGAHSYSIFVDIISPNGDQIADLKFIAAKNGDFSTVWIIPRGLDDGTYTINLRDVKKQTQTTFNIQSVSTTPIYAFDSDFVLECSTWYESYEITTKSEFIMVWGYGAADCYRMLDSWTSELFLWHNQEDITNQELIQAITYLMRIGKF